MKTFSFLPNFQKSPTQLRKLLAIVENPQRGLNTELTKLGTADRWLRYNGSVRFRETEGGKVLEKLGGRSSSTTKV